MVDQKLSILINAYACSPNMGSEPGMAWNWCTHLAKHCELHIITEGEFRENIETVLPTLPQGKNMHFYYNPVPEKIRNMCWNQGDWRFYKYYKKWQYKTYEIGLDIIQNTPIDIVHQLNMIGFREPGYLWKIQHKPFVWGPIGGLKQFPVKYLAGAGIKMQLFNRLKNVVNIWQLKYDRRVNQALRKAKLLISAAPDSYAALNTHKHIETVRIPETGCFPFDEIADKQYDLTDFHIIWVGKFDFRKQLPLALKAIQKTGNKNMILDVYGSGNKKQEQEINSLRKKLGLEEQVIFHHNKPHSIVQNAMRKSQLLLFTSVNDDTSTVVLEAIGNKLPVLCFDAFGFGAVVSEKVGIKIPLSEPKKSVIHFSEQINYLYNNRDVLQELSQNCIEQQKKLSWDAKAVKMVELYKNILNQ
ncbi:MAG: glycosyltransferase [Paludibacteraceae bacterium]